MNQIPGEIFGQEPIFARQPSKGIGEAVAKRTIFRPEDEEDWGKVADRVSEGNISLLSLLKDGMLGEGGPLEQKYLRNAIACGALLTSGRHLQHGDENQINYGMEKFSNCSTSATTYALVLLLLCGSGVGRSYDDDLMLIDWKNAPDIWLILNPKHKDFLLSTQSKIEFFKTCVGYDSNPTHDEADLFYERFVHTNFPDGNPPPQGAPYYKIDDSREGWAKSVEILEAMTFNKEKNGLLILDFSNIRERGTPVNGMQGRGALGPIPWLRAFIKLQLNVIEPAKREEIQPWEQTMRADHYFAEEIVSGGIRMSARMSTKSWRDLNVFDFIKIKNAQNLWTSNNSVMVDKEFWDLVRNKEDQSKLGKHAKLVFEKITENSYQTGEPGIINGDKLEDYKTGFARKKPVYFNGEDCSSAHYQTQEAKKLLTNLNVIASNTRFPMIVNPCGEIPLITTGSFCIISDIAPVLAARLPLAFKPGKASNEEKKDWDSRVEEAIKLGVRFLIRVNLMDSIYNKEVLRTNRIGIGITGIHEWAWLRFGLGFRDLLNEDKSAEFWNLLSKFSQIAKDEANSYSDYLGLNHPSTVTTVKPSGSVSKLFSLTEGVHLPARKQYLRWVQFKGMRGSNGDWVFDSDPLLKEYEDKNYPIKELKTFQNRTAVGFPTQLLLQDLKIGNKCVIAPNATPEEQYKWLQLLERYWLGESQAAQISYTLKIYKNKHSLDEFRSTILENQPLIKCCSILPSVPDSEMGYEYLPEEVISESEYKQIKRQIGEPIYEDIDMETLRCESGVCPI